MSVKVHVFRGDQELRAVQLEAGQGLVIGRGADADLRLRDLEVEAQHARVGLDDEGHPWIEDLRGSAEGAAPSRASAGLPCRIKIGRHRIELRAEDGLAPEAGSERQSPTRVWDMYQRGPLLGQGGFGRVFSARRKDTGRPVAVKELILQLESAERDRFLREARLCESFDHPNVVRVHRTQVEGERGYQVMEKVDGFDLHELVELEGPLPPARALDVLESVARGLQAIHAADVVHRDIKPENVLLAEDGSIKIADFGLARARGVGDTLTKSLIGMGTMAYVAPEQAKDAKRAGPPADLYGLGATVYHALAGRPPFDQVRPGDLVAAVMEQEPPPLTQLRPDCPPALAQLVEGLLVKDPADRCQTAAALLERVANVRATLEAV
jgi:serine/threonine-protein kinase